MYRNVDTGTGSKSRKKKPAAPIGAAGKVCAVRNVDTKRYVILLALFVRSRRAFLRPEQLDPAPSPRDSSGWL